MTSIDAKPSLAPKVRAHNNGLLVLQVCLVRTISKVMHTRNSQQMLRRHLPLVLGSASIKIQVQQQAMLLLGMHMQDSLQLMMAWAVNRMDPSILLVFSPLHPLLKCPLLPPFDVSLLFKPNFVLNLCVRMNWHEFASLNGQISVECVCVCVSVDVGVLWVLTQVAGCVTVDCQVTMKQNLYP